MASTTNKIKVLYVITKSNFGGAQRYVYDLATKLPGEKFDIAVALGGEGVLAEMLREAGVRTISIPSLDRDISIVRDVASFFALWKLFRHEKPEIVHLNSSKVGGIGALAGRFACVPKIIFTAHAWAFNEDRSRLSRFAIKILSWVTVLLSHDTIAVSNAIMRSVEPWPFIKNKIFVIKNGVSEPTFFDREMARRALCNKADANIPGGAFIIGTIAELHRNKGLRYAIEALSKLVEHGLPVYYMILGGGEEEEQLGALIKQLGLQKHVFLLGFTKDAPRFLTAFDAFVLPSITEALGIVILEAGLARLPVVATNVGGIPEVVSDGKTGLLVSPRSPAEIVAALARIIESDTLRQSLGFALRSKVVEEFSCDGALSATMSLYTRK